MTQEKVIAEIFKIIKESVDKKIKYEYFPIRKRNISKFRKNTLKEIETHFEGVTFVVGKLKAVDKAGVQSIRFNTNVWTKNEAKRWYKNNLEKIKKLVEA
jgi:hypothetical protein